MILATLAKKDHPSIEAVGRNDSQFDITQLADKCNYLE